MIELDLFPIKCFLLNMPNHKDVLQEALSCKEQIQKVGKETGKTWHESHFTDFSKTVKNNSFELGLEKVLTDFHKASNLTISVTEYWTAFYGRGAMHEPHVHTVSVFDRVNYSGVLYLTEGGGTTLFSPHSLTTETHTTTRGRPGDISLFPSSIPHTFTKTTDSTTERVVIAFNLHMYGAF